MAKKILVIDDDPTVIKLIQSRLEANHYEVITAPDGQEGLNKAVEQKPDLITLDILMPKVDGFTFVKEIKRVENLRDTPIIIITTKEQLQDLFKQEGINDYLVKPLQIKELLEKIQKHLGEPDDELSIDNNPNTDRLNKEEEI